MPDPNPAVVPPASPAAPTPGTGGQPSPTPAPASGPQPAPAGQPGAATPDPATSGSQQTVPLTALHEEREKRQALQAELESLRKVAGQGMLYDAQGNPVAQQQQQQRNQPQPDVRQQIDQLWDTDPRKAVQAEMMVALNWYDQVNVAIDNQESALAEKHKEFNDYRDQVRRYIRALPPDQRARDGIVETAYYAVRGKNVDSIINQRLEAEKADLLRRIQAGENVQGLNPGAVSSPSAPAGQVNLSDDQRKACAALGIAEADYIANMKR